MSELYYSGYLILILLFEISDNFHKERVQILLIKIVKLVTLSNFCLKLITISDIKCSVNIVKESYFLVFKKVQNSKVDGAPRA